MNKIFLIIPGPPIPKPRMTKRDRWAKRPAVQKYWEYKDRVKFELAKTLENSDIFINLDLVTEVNMVFYVSFPQSYSSKKRDKLLGAPHSQKPDVDNFAKACLDSVFDEDKNIYSIHCTKYWEDIHGSRTEVILL